MVNTRGIHIGMVVHSADGHRLGRIVGLGEERFQIEKGLFFPKEYLASYADVERVEGDDVRLVQGRDQLVASELDASKGMQSAAGNALGELGKARMERYHDVIGAAPPPAAPPNSEGRPELRAAPEEEPKRRLGLVEDEPVRE